MNSLALSDTLGTSFPSGKVTEVELMIVWTERERGGGREREREGEWSIGKGQ